jgi:MFS family permease
MTDRNRWTALYVLCAGVLMIVLDVTVVNVALPSIQDDLGFSQSSLAWVVNAYLIAFGGLLLLAGRLGDLLGPQARPGMVLIVVGLVLFSLAPVDGSYVRNVLPVMILLGLGIGISFPALLTAMSGATQADAGPGSGLVNTTAQVGGALGLAVLATLSATRSDNLIEDGKSTASAPTSGYHLSFLIGAALGAVAIVVALVVLESKPQVEEQTAPDGARYPEAA